MPNDTPEPTVAVGKLAELFSMTAVRVQQLAKMGVVIKAERGHYDLWKSIKGYIGYLQDRAAGKSGGGEPGDYDAQRTRLYKARADAQEVLAARLMGTVHDSQSIAAVMNEMVSKARAKFLALPTICASQVADITDPNQCKDILTHAVHEALKELSDYPAHVVMARQLNEPPPVDVDAMTAAQSSSAEESGADEAGE